MEVSDSKNATNSQETQLMLANPFREQLKGHCVWFLRRGSNSLKANNICEYVTCGEVIGPSFDSIHLNLMEVYKHILSDSQWEGWKDCKVEDQREMLSTFDSVLEKFSNISEEARKVVEIAKPDQKILLDDRSSLSSDSRMMQAHCETILTKWCDQAEELLKEQEFDSSAKLMDVIGPKEEGDGWRTRLMRLVGFTDQLRLPECKQVITVNSTSHSKSSRRWKILELRISDAISATKENVRHFALLEPRLDKLYQPKPKVAEIYDSILPIFQGVQLLCVSAKSYQVVLIVCMQTNFADSFTGRIRMLSHSF